MYLNTALVNPSIFDYAATENPVTLSTINNAFVTFKDFSTEINFDQTKFPFDILIDAPCSNFEISLLIYYL